MTYGELDRRVERIAARIRDLGAEPGARVALVCSLRMETVVTIHGVARAGCTLAPLSPRWTAVELGEALRALRPGVLIYQRDTEEKAIEALGRAELGATPALSVDAGGGVFSPERTAPPGEPIAQTPDDPVSTSGKGPRARSGGAPGPTDGPAAVLWTSGTHEGRRGVELGWPAISRHIEAVRARLDLGPDDRWHAGLSPAHVGGLMLILRAAAVGSRLVMTGPFDAHDLARMLNHGRVTHASLVPVMLRRLLEASEGRPAPETLQCLLLGGAHTPRALLDQALAAGYPVALTYGMTEASSQVATAPPELVGSKPGTVGPPLEGVELRIAAAGESDGSDRESGEILVRGPTLAVGYVDGGHLTDADGWYHTGDLGRLDGEGHLWITGRISDRIVTGGVTVDPREVEEALRCHTEVADAAVVGVPDDEWGERVVAAVVPSDSEGDEPREALDARLETFLRERLSSAKRPRALRSIESVPRNENGKVDRAAVARLFQGGEGEDG